LYHYILDRRFCECRACNAKLNRQNAITATIAGERFLCRLRRLDCRVVQSYSGDAVASARDCAEVAFECTRCGDDLTFYLDPGVDDRDASAAGPDNPPAPPRAGRAAWAPNADQLACLRIVLDHRGRAMTARDLAYEHFGNRERYSAVRAGNTLRALMIHGLLTRRTDDGDAGEDGDGGDAARALYVYYMTPEQRAAAAAMLGPGTAG
jgi:hypothetical protein